MSRPSSVIFSGPQGGIHTQLIRKASTMLTPSSGSMTSFSASSTASKSVGASAETMALDYARWREIAVVTLIFEAVGKLRSALLGHTAVDEYVDEVRVDVAENPRVVSDQQHAEAGVL